MKKIKFFWTFIFFIGLVVFSCSAEDVVFVKGAGIPNMYNSDKPSIAIKVFSGGRNIIKPEDQLKIKSFEGFVDISKRNLDLDVAPGTTIEIIAEVFGGQTKEGAFKYFSNETDPFRFTASKDRGVIIRIDLRDNKVEFAVENSQQIARVVDDVEMEETVED